MEASIGGGGVGGGSGESEVEGLLEGTVVGCGTLKFLTWTEEGWSEDTCFCRDRIYRKTEGHVQLSAGITVCVFVVSFQNTVVSTVCTVPSQK